MEDKQSLVTDINEARKDREEAPEEQSEFMGELENADFTVNEDDSIFDQYASLHGTLLTRAVKKIQLSGGQIGQEDANYLAHTIQNILQQEVMFGILEYIGAENINEIIPEEKQDEIVSMFGVKQNLDVSPEDIQKLQGQLDSDN